MLQNPEPMASLTAPALDTEHLDRQVRFATTFVVVLSLPNITSEEMRTCPQRSCHSRLKATVPRMTQEEAPSSRFSDYNEALLADLLANSADILSLYSPDLLLTHSSVGLSAALGREVLPGT